MYRKFTSDRIFTGIGWAPDGSILIIDEQGVVMDLVSQEESGEDIQLLNGILCPGFINTHVHLELSHMKDIVPAGTGLVNFLLEVVKGRHTDQVQIQKEIAKAASEMWAKGIVAAGDICNTTHTLEQKGRSSIKWNNFIEVLNLSNEKAIETIGKYKAIAYAFQENINAEKSFIGTALSPHSPYSVSTAAFEMINEATNGKTITMHNQECQAENELYLSGKGDFLKLYNFFGLESSPIKVTGQTSIRSILPYFNQQQRIILVHNTYTTAEDFDFVMDYAVKNKLEIFFCLCPNANLYIENTLPDVKLMMKKNLPLVLGTDSYSSNQQLSIAAEITTIHNRFPEIELGEILGWATLGGAKALKIENDSGSFTKGKKPGVVLLDNSLNPFKIA